MRSSRIARAAIVAFLPLVVSCAGDTTFRATGRVTDGFRGTPLGEVQVTLYRVECIRPDVLVPCTNVLASTTTEADGTYELSVSYDPADHTPERLELHSLVEGYQNAEVDVLDEGTRIEVDVELEPVPTLVVSSAEATVAERSTEVELTWNDTSGSAYPNVLVLRREGSPDFVEPDWGTELAGGDSLGDALVVYSGPKTTLRSTAGDGAYLLADDPEADGTEISYAVLAWDDYLAYSLPSTTYVTTPDLTPPENVTALEATVSGFPGSYVVRVTWHEPLEDYTGALVLRREGAAVAAVPEDGVAYERDDILGDSTVLLDTPGSEAPDTGVVEGTTYHYRVFAHDTFHNYAPGVSVEVTP